MMRDPRHTDPEFRETQRASRALGISLQSLEVREAGDFEIAFQTAARERIEAPEPLNLSLRQIETRDLFILSTD